MSALKGKEPATKINPQRLNVLNEVYNAISDLAEDEAELNLRPRFASGDVSVKLQQMHFGSEQLQKLKEILVRCNTLEVLPLRDGKIEVSVTVDGVFDTTE